MADSGSASLAASPSVDAHNHPGLHILCGHLLKLKSSVPRMGSAWNKRWFTVLPRQTRFGRLELCLCYFKSIAASKDKATVPKRSSLLSDIDRITPLVEASALHAFTHGAEVDPRRRRAVQEAAALCFEIETIAGERMVLQAPTRRSLHIWVHGLQRVSGLPLTAPWPSKLGSPPVPPPYIRVLRRMPPGSPAPSPADLLAAAGGSKLGTSQAHHQGRDRASSGDSAGGRATGSEGRAELRLPLGGSEEDGASAAEPVALSGASVPGGVRMGDLTGSSQRPHLRGALTVSSATKGESGSSQLDDEDGQDEEEEDDDDAADGEDTGTSHAQSHAQSTTGSPVRHAIASERAAGRSSASPRGSAAGAAAGAATSPTSRAAEQAGLRRRGGEDERNKANPNPDDRTKASSAGHGRGERTKTQADDDHDEDDEIVVDGSTGWTSGSQRPAGMSAAPVSMSGRVSTAQDLVAAVRLASQDRVLAPWERAPDRDRTARDSNGRAGSGRAVKGSGSDVTRGFRAATEEDEDDWETVETRGVEKPAVVRTAEMVIRHKHSSLSNSAAAGPASIATAEEEDWDEEEENGNGAADTSRPGSGEGLHIHRRGKTEDATAASDDDDDWETDQTSRAMVVAGGFGQVAADEDFEHDDWDEEDSDEEEDEVAGDKAARGSAAQLPAAGTPKQSHGGVRHGTVGNSIPGGAVIGDPGVKPDDNYMDDDFDA